MDKLLKDKKVLITGFVVILLIIVLLVCFVFNGKKSDENNTNSSVNNETNITEKDIEDSYGFSGDDAIKLVKQSFNSDTFEFSYEISSESKYIVTAKSKIEGDTTEFKFEVDPITKSYYAIN